MNLILPLDQYQSLFLVQCLCFQLNTKSSNKVWVIATFNMMYKERLMKLVPLGLSGVLAKPLHPHTVRKKLKELCQFPTKMELSDIKETVEKWKMF
jgi:hypothetical protein